MVIYTYMCRYNVSDFISLNSHQLNMSKVAMKSPYVR